MPAAGFTASQIRRYYDRQTAGFLALGQGGGEAAIHRAGWGPGVTTLEEAFHFVEDQIAEGLSRLDPGDDAATPHVVDLGCGVCGSLTYLASRLPIRATRITLSSVARIASDRIRTIGLEDRVACVEGDYTQMPTSVPAADLAFAEARAAAGYGDRRLRRAVGLAPAGSHAGGPRRRRKFVADVPCPRPPYSSRRCHRQAAGC